MTGYYKCGTLALVPRVTANRKPAPTGVRLPEALREQLERMAAEREMNLSEFIRYAVMFYVDYTRAAPA